MSYSKPLTRDERAEQIVDRLFLKVGKVVRWISAVILTIMLMAFVFEVKRAFEIDLIPGVNFKIDDWYFDTFRN